MDEPLDYEDDHLEDAIDEPWGLDMGLIIWHSRHARLPCNAAFASVDELDQDEDDHLLDHSDEADDVG